MGYVYRGISLADDFQNRGYRTGLGILDTLAFMRCKVCFLPGPFSAVHRGLEGKCFMNSSLSQHAHAGADTLQLYIWTFLICFFTYKLSFPFSRAAQTWVRQQCSHFALL